MTLSDKIVMLRKKNGLSQEELAEKMNVSRQAVSKWEGAQSLPDIDKVVQLCNLFGVTTDYLLKDESEQNTFMESSLSMSMVKRVTMDDAEEYLSQRNKSSFLIAVATFLCIISSIPLIILGAATEVNSFGISENVAGGVGIICLLALVAVAVSIFVYCDFKNSPYKFLEKEIFDTERGVTEMLKKRQSEYRNTYVKFNVIGICICILSPIPLFIGAFIENDFFIAIMLALTMIIAGIGVMLFIISNVQHESMQKLLKIGDYSQKEKKKRNLRSTVSSIYWLTITAIYLANSFATDDWNSSWIIWPVAGVIFAAVMTVCNFFTERSNDRTK